MTENKSIVKNKECNQDVLSRLKNISYSEINSTTHDI